MKNIFQPTSQDAINALLIFFSIIGTLLLYFYIAAKIANMFRDRRAYVEFEPRDGLEEYLEKALESEWFEGK